MTAADWLGELQEANRLFEQRRLDEAEARARHVLELNPRAALAHQLIGLVHVDRFEIQESIERLGQALALRPDLPAAHNSLGHCQVLLGNDRQALDHFNAALLLEPQHVFAHYNRAVTWLKLGQFHEGWVEHEWRFAAGVAKRQQVARPHWDGGTLENRSLLIYTEQGLGDCLHFARFLPMLRRRARRLVIACHHPLQPFLQSLGCIDEWFPIDQPHAINFDVYAAMMSVPALLNVDEPSIPRAVPYLVADPDRIEAWRRPVRGLPGFKVGVAWQGNPLFRVDRYRSIPLRHFAALASVPGVTLVSLQHGAGLEQVEPNRKDVSLTLLPELDRDGIFLDRAAVLQHLDLVITSDTSIAHLAGGLGRPVWLALAVNSDWRWLRDRSDSPWYPTMRIFRQRTFGDWAGVFEEIAEALRRLLRERALVPVPAPAGEVLDRIVEREYAPEPTSREKLAREMEQLQQLRRDWLTASPELDEHFAALERLHHERASIERELRLQPEAPTDQGNRVAELLRKLDRINEERAARIAKINELVASSVG